VNSEDFENRQMMSLEVQNPTTKHLVKRGTSAVEWHDESADLAAKSYNQEQDPSKKQTQLAINKLTYNEREVKFSPHET
jgi:hypothetical protein